jgi:flagellar assembly protein FliH
MNTNKTGTNEVPSLIDKILKSNDPATVGLRRIIKKKSEEGIDYPARIPTIESFDMPGKSNILSDDERRILELEKKVIELEEKCKRQVLEQKKAEEIANKNGYADGMKKGVEKGAAETAALYEKKIDRLQREIKAFLKIVEGSKNSIYVNTEHLLLKMALEIAKKVVNSEIASNPEVIVNVVKKALTHIADRERIIIHVSPQDCTVVSNRKDFWNTITDNLNNIVIMEDNRIEKGGCLIESNSGVVDARLGVQLDEVCSIIENEWERAHVAVENGVDVFIETDIEAKGE